MNDINILRETMYLVQDKACKEIIRDMIRKQSKVVFKKVESVE